MAGDLAPGLLRIAGTPQVVPVGQGCERTVEGKNFEAMPAEIEFADDFRSKKRHDVGRNREPETGNDLFGDRRAAHDVPPLEDQYPAAGTSEVCGVNEAIVASADHDNVICGRHEKSRTQTFR